MTIIIIIIIIIILCVEGINIGGTEYICKA
jgi:hypothetical protein